MKTKPNRIEIFSADGSGIVLPREWTATLTNKGFVIYAAARGLGEFWIPNPDHIDQGLMSALREFFAKRGVELESVQP